MCVCAPTAGGQRTFKEYPGKGKSENLIVKQILGSVGELFDFSLTGLVYMEILVPTQVKTLGLCLEIDYNILDCNEFIYISQHMLSVWFDICIHTHLSHPQSFQGFGYSIYPLLIMPIAFNIRNL